MSSCDTKSMGLWAWRCFKVYIFVGACASYLILGLYWLDQWECLVERGRSRRSRDRILFGRPLIVMMSWPAYLITPTGRKEAREKLAGRGAFLFDINTYGKREGISLFCSVLFFLSLIQEDWLLEKKRNEDGSVQGVGSSRKYFHWWECMDGWDGMDVKKFLCVVCVCGQRRWVVGG